MKERTRRLRIAQYKTELRAYKIVATHRGISEYFKKGEVPKIVTLKLYESGLIFEGHWKKYADLIINYSDFTVIGDIYDPNDDSSFEIYFNEWIKWAIKETKKDLKRLKKR